MDGEQHSSFAIRLLSLAFFLVLALAALAWFTISILGSASQLGANESIVAFDKGSMYMLGIGFGLLFLTLGGGMQGLIGKELTLKQESLFKRGLIISCIVMAGFPHLAHYVVSSYVHNNNYIVCRDATYRWLLYSKFYYAKNNSACHDFISKKEITKSSSGR